MKDKLREKILTEVKILEILLEDSKVRISEIKTLLEEG